jgi:hypothetical protein
LQTVGRKRIIGLTYQRVDGSKGRCPIRIGVRKDVAGETDAYWFSQGRVPYYNMKGGHRAIYYTGIKGLAVDGQYYEVDLKKIV